MLRHYRVPLSYEMTTFQIPGQKLSKNLVGILVQTMTPNGHFEINSVNFLIFCASMWVKDFLVLSFICLECCLVLVVFYYHKKSKQFHKCDKAKTQLGSYNHSYSFPIVYLVFIFHLFSCRFFSIYHSISVKYDKHSVSDYHAP